MHATRVNNDNQYFWGKNMNPPGRAPPLPPKSPPAMDEVSKQDLSKSPSKKFKPFMKGYLEKGTGEKPQLHWQKRLVEVIDGTFSFSGTLGPKTENNEITIDLTNSLVSVQEKNILRIETEGKVRFFRASSQSQAYKWANVISRYCLVPAIAEGPCKKLSNRKDVFESRFLKLTGDGILQWYEKEDDSKSKGALMIKGEEIKTNEADSSLVYVCTGNRDYEFKFIDAKEAELWIDALSWYSQMTPEDTSIPIRNKKNN